MTTEVLTPEKILFFGHPMWEKDTHAHTHTSLMSQKVSSFLKKYLREWTMFQSRDKKVTSPPSGNLPSTISETDKLKKLQWSDCKSYCLNLYKNKSAIVIILLLSSGTVQNIIKKKVYRQKLDPEGKAGRSICNNTTGSSGEGEAGSSTQVWCHRPRGKATSRHHAPATYTYIYLSFCPELYKGGPRMCKRVTSLQLVYKTALNEYNWLLWHD